MAETSLNVVITSDPAGAITGLRAVKDAADYAGSGMTKSFDKATSETGNLFTHLGQSMANWGIPFAQTVENVGKKLDDAKSHGKGFQQGLSDVGATALVVGGVALAGIGYESVKMADDFESAQRRLQTALKNTNESFTANAGVIQAANSQGEKYGYTYTQTESALASGVTATGNVTQATKELTIAENVAAGRHIDLASAMNLVVKAGEGQTTALHRAGIDLPIVASSALKVQNAYLGLVAAQDKLSTVQSEVADGQLKGKAALDGIASAQDKVGAAQQKLTGLQSAGGQVLDALSSKYKGAADAAGKTLGGQLGTLSAQFQDVGIKIGQFLIPKLEDIGNAISDVIGWFQRNKDVAVALAGVFGGVLAAAIAAFTINKVVSVAKDMATAFNSLKNGAQAVEQGLGRLIGIIQAHTAASGEDATATEADATALEAQGAGAETASAGFFGIGAAVAAVVLPVAALAYGIVQLTGQLNSAPVLTAANDYQIFTGAVKASPAAMLAAAGSLDQLTGSGDRAVQMLERSAQYHAAVAVQARSNAAAQLSLKQSEDGVGEALQSLTNLQSSGTASAVDLQSAQDQVSQSLLQVTGAAKQQADVMTQGQSATERARAENNNQYNSLIALAQEYPGLTGQIETYISQLHLTPPTVATKATLDTSAAMQAADSYLSELYKIQTAEAAASGSGLGPGVGHGVGLAEGGIVTGPQIALIGEAGAEAVIPLSDPARAGEILTQANLIQPFPSGAVASSGGTAPVQIINNVTVSTMVASDPAGIGQALITDFLEPAERRMGTDWRQRTHR